MSYDWFFGAKLNKGYCKKIRIIFDINRVEIIVYWSINIVVCVLWKKVNKIKYFLLLTATATTIKITSQRKKNL